MSAKARVSRRVHAGVHLPGSPESTSSTPSATIKSRGPGPYLARSGRIYLFQIRLPKVLGGGRGSRPLRLSLGAIPHSEARVLADTLAAQARGLFDSWTKTVTMTNDKDDEYITPDVIAAHMLGSMRAVFATRKAGVFDHPQTPFGKLAMLEREEEKAKAGEEHNTILVENADELRIRYLREGDAVLKAGVRARMPNPNVLEGSLEDWNLYPDLNPVTSDTSAEPNVVRSEKSSEAMSTTALTPADVAGLSRSVKVDGIRVAAYDLDRRHVARPPSNNRFSASWRPTKCSR